jgi:hypothetical protein
LRLAIIGLGLLLGAPAIAQDQGAQSAAERKAMFTPVQLAERAVYRRAIEAVNWGIPVVNYDRMYQAMVGIGGSFNQIVYWSGRLDWRSQTLTPNADVIVFIPFFSTKDVGPMVLEIPAATDQASCFELRVEGEGADFTGLEVYRDIYYTEDGKKSEFEIPPGCYVMLGDNTQDSSDSRFWTFITLGPDSEGKMVRGNYFPPQNPVSVPGDPLGTRVFLRDEWGDLHDFIARQDQAPKTEWAPFVRREMIVGRAVAVFWPLSLAHKVWRLQWVH